MNLNKENIFSDFDDVVKVKDLQKMLKVGRNFAYKLIGENKIEHIKINNKIFIPKQSIINFLCKGGVNER